MCLTLTQTKAYASSDLSHSFLLKASLPLCAPLDFMCPSWSSPHGRVRHLVSLTAQAAPSAAYKPSRNNGDKGGVAY